MLKCKLISGLYKKCVTFIKYMKKDANKDIKQKIRLMFRKIKKLKNAVEITRKSISAYSLFSAFALYFLSYYFQCGNFFVGTNP